MRKDEALSILGAARPACFEVKRNSRSGGGRLTVVSRQAETMRLPETGQREDQAHQAPGTTGVRGACAGEGFGVHRIMTALRGEGEANGREAWRRRPAGKGPGLSAARTSGREHLQRPRAQPRSWVR